MNYKYHLLKYKGPASRLVCPNCGRKRCFAPYVDDNDQIIGEEYGRCDHESSCGYVKYPPSEKDWRETYGEFQQRTYRLQKRMFARPQQKAESEQQICAIPDDIVIKTRRPDIESDFVIFLKSLFDSDTVSRVINEYQLGVTKSGDVIFYQFDKRGRCRTGKIMKYNRSTGHRIKDSTAKTPITWVHSLLKQKGMLPQDWELTQCLFGEHLLQKYLDKPVCLVEAEKTAIICSAILPKFIWVAVGGKTQLGDKVEVLEGRITVAFPDVDGYKKWREKINERPYLNIQVSDYLEKNATLKDRDIGADIADILIRWRTSLPGNVKLHIEPPPQEERYPDNLEIQEVMKYISPEYWDNVDALICELDMELVSVTQHRSVN